MKGDILSVSVELCGTILFFFFGLFYIFLYSIDKEKKNLLATATSFFFISLFFPLTGTQYIYRFLPELPFNLYITVNTLTLLGLLLSIIAYYNAINKKILSDAFTKAIFFISSVYSISVLFISLSKPQYYLILTMAFIEAVICYVLFRLWKLFRITPPNSDVRKRILLNFIYMGSLLIAMPCNSFYNIGLISFKQAGSVSFILFAVSAFLVPAYQFSHIYKNMIRMDLVKDEFITKTSYNLKAPLVSLINIADALTAGDGKYDYLTEDTSQKAAAIKNSALRLLDIVNSTLDVALLRNHQLMLDISSVDMRVCTELVGESCSELALNKNIRILNHVPSGLMTEADERRVRQILWNLVDNSIHNMDKGTIMISGKQTGGRIYIAVEDTGYGIPPDKQEDIFHPYVSLRYQGIGLGLYISRQLLELMNGEIHLEWSKLNKGSRFSFSLPAYHRKNKASDMDSRKEMPRLNSLLPAYSSPVVNKVAEHNILIIDDEQLNIHTAAYILEKEHYGVYTSYSGSDALDKIKNYDIDLVILDVMMPGQSGINICRKIREQYSFIELPILISTVSNIDYDLDLAMKAGANDLITKPFDEKEMAARVRTLIALKSSMENVLKSELAFLQAQIKPHFIYNAINTMVSFCYTDSEKAAQLLVNFSKYLRLTFDIDYKLMIVPLRREIEMIKAYVEIEKARFGELIHVVYDIEPQLMDIELPPLCIQPLVENAIKHGLCKKETGGTVSVSAKVVNGVILIKVRDTGIGMAADTVDKLKNMEYKSEGVGFFNVSRRIKSWRNAGINIESTQEEGTTVTITVAR